MLSSFLNKTEVIGLYVCPSLIDLGFVMSLDCLKNSQHPTSVSSHAFSLSRSPAATTSSSTSASSALRATWLWRWVAGVPTKLCAACWAKSAKAPKRITESTGERAMRKRSAKHCGFLLVLYHLEPLHKYHKSQSFSFGKQKKARHFTQTNMLWFLGSHMKSVWHPRSSAPALPRLWHQP